MNGFKLSEYQPLISTSNCSKSAEISVRINQEQLLQYIYFAQIAR